MNDNSNRSENSSSQKLQHSDPVRASLVLAMTQVIVWPFFYINVLMLFTFFRKEAFKAETRYILFAQTLLVDLVFLLIVDFVILHSYFFLQLPVGLCIPICMLMEALTCCSPLTITAMCLERYVAICMPLRHAGISTTSITMIVIYVTWMLSALKPFIDLFILIATTPKSYFAEFTFCHYEIMVLQKWHINMRAIGHIVDFILIILILLFCYVMVILATQAASGDSKKSASKGQRTLLLHLLQLILCMIEKVCPYIEAVLLVQVGIKIYLAVRVFNYFTFSLFSRAVSPIVYGLRDARFYTAMMYYAKCRMNQVSLDT